MNVTGVGSTYNFIYNTKTGKLSTKDGSKNEFVDFCNGDVKGEDTETLNHFCLLYTSPSPRDRSVSRMPSSA